MNTQGSPGIIIKEQDLSTYVQSTAPTIGATVGNFQWGEIGEIRAISNEGDLVRYFGYPTDENYKDWFTARNYLAYSNALKLSRCQSDGMKNASDVVLEATLIKNESDFTTLLGTLSEEGKTAKIFARCPGEYGNFRVVISDKAALEASDSVLKPYVSKLLEDDDVAVGIFKNGALVEYGMYNFNKNSVDINGYPNYIISAINKNSGFIFLVESKLITYTEAGARNPIDIDTVLAGGFSGIPTAADYKLAWELFRNADGEDVSLLMQAGADTEVGALIIEIADMRKDCVACVSPKLTDIVNVADPTENIIETGKSYANSSYRFYDSNYKYQLDVYNDTYRWVPMNADMAGLMAYTDLIENPWYSPGGKTIRDCIKLAWYPNKMQRDTLFINTANPITSMPGQGTVLWGDWTGALNTSFNFVNVRRCFIYMEKAIAEYARTVMWKQNDAVTRATFYQAVEPFLRNMKNSRAVSDYKVYADETVNTPDIIDQGLFVAKIAVKPIRSIRWVELTFIATRSDVNFDEAVIVPTQTS